MGGKRIHLFVVALAVALAGSSIALADGGGGKKGHGRGNGSGNLSARLNGYQETPSINTTGSGRFTATVGNNQITYRLDYSNLSGPPTMAHIHFAQRHVAGGIVAWLCGAPKPACPASTSGSVTGTIVASDVQALPTQGFNAGDYAALVRAIRAHATYANMHTAKFPNGEIR